MSEWKKVKLKDVATNITDGKHGDCKDQRGSGYFFVSCKDVYDGEIHYENARQITKEDFEDTDKRTKLAPDDILITNSGTIGRMAFVKDQLSTRKTTFQKSVAIVKPDSSKVFPLYLYYLLQSKVGEFVNSSNGAAQKNLLLSTMRDFDLDVLNSIPYQIRIATILSRYDSLIENYQKQIKLLEEAAQRLYKEWFVNLRFPGYENTKIVDGVPEGWKKKSVSQLGEYLNGFAFKPSDWQETGKPIIKIKEMGNGVSEETPRNNGERVPAKYLVKAGDLLFSWSATLMVIVWTGEDGWLNQHLFKVTPAKGIGREFLLQTISNAISEFSNLTTGSTMKHIQRNKLDQVSVNVPSSDMMEKYNDIAESLRTKVINVSAQIRLLTEARDRLLPKLMSGEMDVILENYPAV